MAGVTHCTPRVLLPGLLLAEWLHVCYCLPQGKAVPLSFGDELLSLYLGRCSPLEALKFGALCTTAMAAVVAGVSAAAAVAKQQSQTAAASYLVFLCESHSAKAAVGTAWCSAAAAAAAAVRFAAAGTRPAYVCGVVLGMQNDVGCRWWQQRATVHIQHVWQACVDSLL